MSTRKLAMVCGCSSRAVAVLVSHCPVYMRVKKPLLPRITHEAIEIPWHPCRPSATALWDVWHTPRGGGYRVRKSSRAGGRRNELQTELTWLANCVRRILAKLMMAVAVEWRAEVVYKTFGGFRYCKSMMGVATLTNDKLVCTCADWRGNLGSLRKDSGIETFAPGFHDLCDVFAPDEC